MQELLKAITVNTVLLKAVLIRLGVDEEITDKLASDIYNAIDKDYEKKLREVKKESKKKSNDSNVWSGR